MSFDARSRERLEALGRQLPQKLVAPTLPTASAGGRASGDRAVDRRHPVETEQDPHQLFRELMDVSPDGSVPPHLLERLRHLEAPPPPSGTPADGPGSAAGPGAGVAPGRRRSPRQRPLKPRPTAGDPHQDLYTAFQQLLLEDDD
ncbi:hypothetical protein [Synechococcus sp. CCY 9618]|uniref:hypothetical protein n=1 Tax=Synechococcus sp. CCY 9618 TaxID=2815602 RepID=UPI001C24DB15|nr:hypothetical protein [Synechococcus sp. CCY 9618]